MAATPIQSIGQMEEYETVKEDDTLIEIAYREDIGYVELRAANPELDPWLPGEGKTVLLPKQHLLPDGPRSGIVINLGEMRLYHYKKPGQAPISYPLGIGREGLDTPMGGTTIVSKRVAPTWIPTPRMRKEHPELPAVVGPGPDNPLGPMALYLGWPEYRIHGTNRPWGIGRRVSSGCLRMYNQDIKKLYNEVPVGTKVTVIDQPVKTAWIDGVFYIEAHPNAAQADEIEHSGGRPDYDISEAEIAAVMKEAEGHADKIDWSKVRKALRYRPGYPMAVTREVKDMKPADKSSEIQQVEKKKSDVAVKTADKAEKDEKKAAAEKPAKKEAKAKTAKPTKEVKTDAKKAKESIGPEKVVAKDFNA